MIRKNKKAQEEIVGFVLIVVLVAVIFLVFLGIAIRRPASVTEKQSKDVSQFLAGLMEYTTECVISSEPAFLSISELISNCYSGSMCISGKTACDVLDKSVLGIMNVSWKMGKESPIKGYEFRARYTKETFEESIYESLKGNCSVNIIGGEYFFSAYPGTITVSLKICQ